MLSLGSLSPSAPWVAARSCATEMEASVRVSYSTRGLAEIRHHQERFDRNEDAAHHDHTIAARELTMVAKLRLRARAKITCRFWLAASGHLRPMRNRRNPRSTTSTPTVSTIPPRPNLTQICGPKRQLILARALKHQWGLGRNYLAGITAGHWWRLLASGVNSTLSRLASVLLVWSRVSALVLAAAERWVLPVVLIDTTTAAVQHSIELAFVDACCPGSSPESAASARHPAPSVLAAGR